MQHQQLEKRLGPSKEASKKASTEVVNCKRP
jgi:hypothetical protein